MGPEDFPISEVTYEEAMRRFKRLYVAERLPYKPISSGRWFASEVSCAALAWSGTEVARLKGAVVEPEWRGLGIGEAMVLHRVQEARAAGARTIEVFTKNPQWFLKHGWVEYRPKGPTGIGVYRGDVSVIDV